MTENWVIENLDDLQARVLACDPADAARVTQLRLYAETVLRSLDAGSVPAEVLKASLKALEGVVNGEVASAHQALDTVAEAVSAVVRHLSNREERTPLEHAEVSVRALSAPAGNEQGLAKTANGVGNSFASASNGDADLIRDFMAESLDRMASAEASLLVLEAKPNDKEEVNTVLRAFHTVKGGAGFLGLDSIQKLAHASENLLIKCRDGALQMRGPQVDVALQSCDALKNMLQSLDPGNPRQESGASAAKFEKLIGLLAHASEKGFTSDDTGVVELDGEDATDRVEAIGERAGSAKTLSEATVRVGASRLDDLLNMIGELVIAHSIIAHDPAVTVGADPRLAKSVSHAGKIVRGLQELTLGMRMVPLRSTFAKMTRLVRDLAHKSDKSVRLITSGEDTEIDRTMVEVLSDPLVHMIRNAVSHGIESSEERMRQGKNAAGSVCLRAYHSAGNIVIEVQDDGRGLNRERIMAKAVERGLVDAGRDITDAEAFALIYHPGLSTADEVTDVSGRGIGMDVVKRSIDSLRGTIRVNSKPGEGSTFTITLPLTVAITDAMLLSVGKERFLLPTIAIEHSFRPQEGMLSTVAGRGEMAMVRGELLPIFRLHRLFGIEGAVDDPKRALLIVIEGGGQRCALMVDELKAQQQVIVKSLGPMFDKVTGVFGGAILGDGRVGLILDAAGIVRLSRGQGKVA